MARYLIGITGASGAAFGVDFVRRCPGEKYLVMSDWGRQVLQSETGLKPSDLAGDVKKLYADADLAAPFSSGSNRFDAFVIVPCSVSTLAKIACGIADTLITRIAAVVPGTANARRRGARFHRQGAGRARRGFEPRLASRGAGVSWAHPRTAAVEAPPPLPSGAAEPPP